MGTPNKDNLRGRKRCFRPRGGGGCKPPPRFRFSRSGKHFRLLGEDVEEAHHLLRLLLPLPDRLPQLPPRHLLLPPSPLIPIDDLPANAQMETRLAATSLCTMKLDGILANSFVNMEPATYAALKDAVSRQGWPPVHPIGPVIHWSHGIDEKGAIGVLPAISPTNASSIAVGELEIPGGWGSRYRHEGLLEGSGEMDGSLMQVLVQATKGIGLIYRAVESGSGNRRGGPGRGRGIGGRGGAGA